MTWLEIIEPLRKSSPATWRTIRRARLVEISPAVLRLHFSTRRKGESVPVAIPREIEIALRKLIGRDVEIKFTTEEW